jgi:hypothetical protein
MNKLLAITLLVLLSLGVRAQDNIRSVPFEVADSVAAKYAEHSLENLPLLAHRLTHDLSGDALKFRAIFMWVCRNIENDYQLFTENQRNRSRLKDPEELKNWNAKMQARMFEALVKKRRTVCTGYAYLIKELCQFAGITAEIVDGYGRTIAANIGGEGAVNHSWTAVRLNAKWYLCDATWASGVIDLTHKQFLKKFDAAYFLADPEYFIRNHYPADLRWTLLNENPTLTTFLNRPIIYSNAYKYKILPLGPDQFEIETLQKKLPFHFKRDSSNDFPIRIMEENGSLQSALAIPDQSEQNTHVIEYTTRPGRHLMHVMVNNEIVFTYAVHKKKN